MEPYKGLRPYEEQDKDNFFGRNAEKQILIDKILTNKLTLLFAASGVGKSSLLQAAVMPQLKEPACENLDVIYHNQWFANPSADLKQTLVEYLQKYNKITDDKTLDQSLPLATFFHFSTIFTSDPLVIILDQFEEFFNYQRHSKYFKTFIRQLAEAVLDRDTPTVFVFSMREDFALELNAFKPELPILLFNNFYRLEKLNQKNARQAITAPIKPLGFNYEPGLVDILLDDLSLREQRDRFGTATDLLDAPSFVEPPHLQIVCMQLWKLNQHNLSQRITIATYQKQGRATNILKDYFVKRVQQLSPQDKKLASAAFNYLVNKHGTKMAYPLGDLAKQIRVNETTLDQTLNKLEQARILRRQKRQNVLWYELYHDIFSKSIYDWNEGYKTQQRIKRVAIGTVAVFSSAALLFMGNDLWVNYTTYHLRLSLKVGISDTIEVYQGKQGSADIFRQQQFRYELNSTRANIETDKLFLQEPIKKVARLNQDLIRAFPLAERLEADWENGDIEKVLSFANQYIGGYNKDLSLQTIEQLAGFRSIKSIDRLKQLLPKQNKKVKVKIIEALGNSQAPRQLQLPQFLLPLTKDDEPDIRKSTADALAKLGTVETIPSLIELFKDPDWTVYLSAANGITQLGASEAVPPLIELLQNTDTEIRSKAAHELAQLGAYEAVPPLIELLKDSDSDVRSRAINGLVQLKAREAVQPLIELLKDTDDSVRSSAAEGLGQLEAREAVQPLIELLKYDNKEVRRSAANGLGQLGAREAVPSLIELLEDDNKEVRSSAIDALAQLEVREAVQRLIQLLKVPTSGIRRSAADGLGQLGMLEAVQPLIKSLKDTDLQVRSSAAIGLGQLGKREAVPPLMALLKDKNWQVRNSAVKGLAQLGAREAIQPLIALFKNKNLNWRVRRRAADVLAQLGAREAVQPLIELFKNTDFDVRRRAAAAWLGQLGAREAVLPLIELLKNTNWKIRYSAADGLGQLGAREAVLPLIQLLKDTNWKARHSAANGLAQLGAREAVKPLIQLFKDTDEDVRSSAADGLGQLGAREAVKPLIQLLKDTDEDVRSSAANGLGKLGAREAIQPLKALLKEDNKEVRWSAFLALTQLGVHELSPLTKNEIATLKKQSHHQSAGQRQ
ncbi:MAG: HEAT repeat domain-containing protein, partial [Thiomargarita sp.]|nr:HEAT repeat domain-containing protein [Thiomargarita sp.]